MNKASVYLSAGLVVLIATIAQTTGHLTGLVLYQIIGSVVATAVLSTVITNFK